jgi:hypothetical protein
MACNIAKSIKLRAFKGELYVRFDHGESIRVDHAWPVFVIGLERNRLAIMDFDAQFARLVDSAAPKTKRIRLVDDDHAPSSKRVYADVASFRDRLARRTGIVDLTEHPEPITSEEMLKANGFITRLPDAGYAFAIKRSAMVAWLAASSKSSMRDVIRAMNAAGWSIRGADGKSTRQVQLPFLGRHRYHCFKLDAARLIAPVAKPPEGGQWPRDSWDVPPPKGLRLSAPKQPNRWDNRGTVPGVVGGYSNFAIGRRLSQ